MAKDVFNSVFNFDVIRDMFESNLDAIRPKPINNGITIRQFHKKLLNILEIELSYRDMMKYLRDDGYLHKTSGAIYNSPTKKSLNDKLMVMEYLKDDDMYRMIITQKGVAFLLRYFIKKLGIKVSYSYSMNENIHFTK